MNTKPVKRDEVFLTGKEVMARYKFGLSTLNEFKKDPLFPDTYRLGPKLSRWKLSELEAWENSNRMIAEIMYDD